MILSKLIWSFAHDSRCYSIKICAEKKWTIKTLRLLASPNFLTFSIKFLEQIFFINVWLRYTHLFQGKIKKKWAFIAIFYNSYERFYNFIATWIFSLRGQNNIRFIICSLERGLSLIKIDYLWLILHKS